MNNYQVSRQWATRSHDERYISLTDMLDVAKTRKKESRQRTISAKNIRFEVADNENIVTYIKGEKDGGKFVSPDRFELTNWSFGQLCERIKCPANYMTRLPAKLAIANLAESVNQAKDEKVQLLTRDGSDTKEVRAVTSEKYGRIWDADILEVMVDQYGDGVTGRYRVPGEFGKDVRVNHANTTMFMSDRNMFVFLCDEENRVEIPNRRFGKSGALARGFYFWNSEVGKETVGVASFYFDYVCCNRIIWGAEEFQEVRLRHSKWAPERFAQDVLPSLTQFTEGSTKGITTAIENARKITFEAPEMVADFLEKSLRLPKRDANNIAMAHLLEEEAPIENMWDVVVGMTAFARSIPFQDQRVALEVEAGKILRKFAA
jgi:hypothetical protein